MKVDGWAYPYPVAKGRDSVSSVPSQPHHRQQDSGVISDVIGPQSFPKICREIGSEVEQEAPSAQPLRRIYQDVIIGFISGVASGSAFVDGGSLNATVRELHLSRPEIVAEKIRSQFLADKIPVNIILHKAEICDAVLSVFDNLVNGQGSSDLVTLFVIPPVNESSNFEAWMKARISTSQLRGHVQIFQSRDWVPAENVEQKPQRRA